MTETSPFDAGLEKSPANFQPLTPLGFLERAAAVYPERTAVVYGTQHTSYGDFYRRCRRLAAALAGRGIGPGAVVAVMAPNVPALLEAHFGVPMAGAVLNPLNVRLDAPAIAEILDHGGAQTVICDRAYGAVMTEALGRLGRAIPVIAIDDGDGPGGELPGATAYEALLGEGDPDFEWRRPGDEWQAISLNYTSGTTGAPKGVVYHHRGAYLNVLGNALAWSLPAHPVCLWTLPMFHCNGWCFPWTVTALAGTHVCLRQVEPGAIFAAIEAHAVTHFCGAPVVLNLLANAPEESRRPLGCTVEVMTAASAPPASVIPRHFQSFADGLRSSLRRRPAAVIVGEARDREERPAQRFDRDMVEKRRQTLPWLPLYKLPYPVSRLCHAFPVLCPARALAFQNPLGLGPSLHRLRRDSHPFVRRLHSYYSRV